MVAWRALEGKKVRFPFGHGLSYTTFSYEWASQPSTSSCPAASGAACMTVKVTNTGAVAGANVVQVYMGSSAPGPLKTLKGFKKTPVLLPGADATLEFALTERDLSMWDVQTSSWRVIGAGSPPHSHARVFDVYVGQSSRDIQLQASFSV